MFHIWKQLIFNWTYRQQRIHTINNNKLHYRVCRRLTPNLHLDVLISLPDWFAYGLRTPLYKRLKFFLHAQQKYHDFSIVLKCSAGMISNIFEVPNVFEWQDYTSHIPLKYFLDTFLVLFKYLSLVHLKYFLSTDTLAWFQNRVFSTLFQDIAQNFFFIIKELLINFRNRCDSILIKFIIIKRCKFRVT